MRQHIEHIEQILPLLKDKSAEFVVIDKGAYKVIDYLYVDRDTFSDPLMLECRGIKFHADGRIMARPLHKFFNLGEKQQEHEIDWALPHVVMDKLDGSMIHPALIGNDLFLMTRKGHTDTAKQAEAKFTFRNSSYVRFCVEQLNLGVTPIFEYTSPDNRIVIPYAEDALSLIAMRRTISGEYISVPEMIDAAEDYGIPVPDISQPTETRIHIQEARNLLGKEGIILRFDDGHMLKVKATDYVLKHRALDDLANKKKMLALVLDNGVDDILSTLGETDRAELVEFRTGVHREMRKNVEDAMGFLNAFGRNERKEFAAKVMEHVAAPYRSLAFASYDGKNPMTFLKNLYRKNPDLVSTKWRRK